MQALKQPVRIVLIRHGARSMDSLSDCSLNERGRAQAQALIETIQPHGSLPTPTRLFASPKKRARETLQPLATRLQLNLQIAPALDERASAETSGEFRARILRFTEDLVAGAKSGDCFYMVSHLDWLEVALMALPTDLPDSVDPGNWSNCEYRVFRINEGLWSAQAHGAVRV